MISIPSRKICQLAAAALGLAQWAVPLHAASAERSTYTATVSTFTVDGVSCGPLVQWKGGDTFADVVTETAGGKMPNKHVANVQYAPISVQVNLPLPATLVTWINDFLAGNSTTKDVVVADVGSDGKTVVNAIEATNAILSEVDFAAVDGASKDAYRLTLVFSPEIVRPGPATVPTTVHSAAKTVISDNFKFTLNGVATDKVSSIAAFSIKRAADTSPTGEKRDYSRTGSVSLGNLVVQVGAAGSDDWTDWRSNFLVKGINADSDEKTASLELDDASKKAVFTVNFSHVGLARMGDVPRTAGGESVRRLQAELYYEAATVGPAGTDSGTKSPDPGSKSDGTSSKPDSSKDTGGKTTDASDSKSTDDSSGKTTSGGSSSDSSSTTAPTSASDDAGAQDPTDFPRIPDLTRLTFTSMRQPASAQETATYSSKLAHDDLVASYEKALKGAGWDETAKNESGDPATGTHQSRLRWMKKGQAADIRLSQLKSDLSGVSADVTTTRAGSLPGINLAKAKVPDALPGKGATGDQGARDPADFPRVSNSTRKSYSSVGSTASPQEMATYATKLPIDQVEAFYVKNLPGTEWTETSRRETGDPSSGNHLITTKWSKGSRTATAALTETNPDNTQIEVTLIGAAK